MFLIEHFALNNQEFLGMRKEAGGCKKTLMLKSFDLGINYIDSSQGELHQTSGHCRGRPDILSTRSAVLMKECRYLPEIEHFSRVWSSIINFTLNIRNWKNAMLNGADDQKIWLKDQAECGDNQPSADSR